MYATNPCSGAHIREQQGLGFWTEIATVGANLVSGAIGGGGSMSIEEYYPAVKAGQLLCPGPYDIGAVAEALMRYPDLEAKADPVLALDRAWKPSSYGPLNAKGKAAALVNWAHGGRNCEITSGETGATRSRAAIEDILQTAAERRSIAAQAAAAAEEAATSIGETATTAAAAVTQANPLLLAAGAAGLAYLALGRR